LEESARKKWSSRTRQAVAQKKGRGLSKARTSPKESQTFPGATSGTSAFEPWIICFVSSGGSAFNRARQSRLSAILLEEVAREACSSRLGRPTRFIERDKRVPLPVNGTAPAKWKSCDWPRMARLSVPVPGRWRMHHAVVERPCSRGTRSSIRCGLIYWKHPKNRDERILFHDFSGLPFVIDLIGMSFPSSWLRCAWGKLFRIPGLEPADPRGCGFVFPPADCG